MTNQSTIDKEVKKKSRKKPEVKIYKKTIHVLKNKHIFSTFCILLISISILILERIIVLKEVLRWI